MSGRELPALAGTGESAQRMVLVYRITFVLLALMIVALFVSYNQQTGWALPDVLALGFTAGAALFAAQGARWAWVAGCMGTALVLKVLAPPAPGLHIEVQLLTCLGLVVLVWLTPRAGWIMTGLAAAYVGLTALTSSATDLSLALDDVCLAVPVIWAAQRFVLVLGHRLDDLDAAHAERVRAELDDGFGGLRESVVERRRQLLHDDLIAALTTLSRPGTVPTSVVQQSCRELADRIGVLDGDDTPDADLGSVLARHAAASGLLVDLDGPSSGITLEPAAVAAVARASAEALRNVRRHAGVDRASIRWFRDDDRVRVRIVDEGSGFSGAAEGWGLSRSVRLPVEQAGGSVRMDSVPGRGTVVELQVPLARGQAGGTVLQRAHDWTVTALAGDQLLPVHLIALTLTANGLLGMRRAWGHDTFWAEAALMAAIAAVALIVGRTLLRRALRAVEVGLLGVVVAGFLLVGFDLRGVESLTTFDSWFIGASAVVITISAFYLPLMGVIGVVMPAAIVLAAAVVELDRPLAYCAGSVVALLIPPIFAYGFGSYIRHSWDQRQVEWERASRAALDAQRRQLAGTIDADAEAWLRLDLVPWLRRIGDGTLSVQDPQVVEASSRMALVVRDELNAPGVLDAGMRRRIAEARASGVDLSFCSAHSGQLEGAASVVRVLDRLLDHAELLDRVVVRLPEPSHPQAEVTWLALRRQGLSPEQRNQVLRPVAHLQPSTTDDGVACTWTWDVTRRTPPFEDDLLGMTP